MPLLPMASVLGAGGGFGSKSAAERRIYRRLLACAESAFVAVNQPRSADLLLHPHDALEHPAEARRASSAAASLARPTAFFSTSDRVEPSSLPWGVLWRTSAFRSRLRPHERIAIGDVPDLADERDAGHPEVLLWRPTPTLGRERRPAPEARRVRRFVLQLRLSALRPWGQQLESPVLKGTLGRKVP
jgi:hypothetical protein